MVGVLALGRSPQDFLPGAYIQFLRIEGTDLADPIRDEARCTGDVKKQLERLIRKLDAHNRTSVDITSGPREIRPYLQAPDALRQIAYNAVMHRTYEATNAPVRVTWYDDRVEILSPERKHEPGGPRSRARLAYGRWWTDRPNDHRQNHR
ncbi:MAG: hypothetical protein F4087_05320 [Gemmatimonadetes bacterium]|nr:hypothetical protein [Gemmatimonadota bacterium]